MLILFSFPSPLRSVLSLHLTPLNLFPHPLPLALFLISGYLDIPNRLPESAGITTADMTSYFLFWLIQLPFFFVNSNHLKYAFMLKVLVVPATAIAMTVSIAKEAGGSGPLVSAPATVFGSDLSFAWLVGLGAVIGNWSTLALNSPGQFLAPRSEMSVTKLTLRHRLQISLVTPRSPTRNSFKRSPFLPLPSSSALAVSSAVRSHRCCKLLDSRADRFFVFQLRHRSSFTEVRLCGPLWRSCNNGTTELLALSLLSPGCSQLRPVRSFS